MNYLFKTSNWKIEIISTKYKTCNNPVKPIRNFPRKNNVSVSCSIETDVTLTIFSKF